MKISRVLWCKISSTSLVFICRLSSVLAHSVNHSDAPLSLADMPHRQPNRVETKNAQVGRRNDQKAPSCSFSRTSWNKRGSGCRALCTPPATESYCAQVTSAKPTGSETKVRVKVTQKTERIFVGLKSKRWTWASIETEKKTYHSSFFGRLFLWGFSFFFTFALWAGEEFSGAKTS